MGNQSPFGPDYCCWSKDLPSFHNSLYAVKDVIDAFSKRERDGVKDTEILVPNYFCTRITNPNVDRVSFLYSERVLH